MKPVVFRINFMRSQEPSYSGYLLEDGRHLIYAGGGMAHMLPVIPFEGNYAQDGEIILVGYVGQDCDEATLRGIYERLRSLSAFDLLTTVEVAEDDAGYLIINEKDDEEPPEPPFHEYRGYR
ncbi:hypothetical protein GCM10008018_60470 [Paenibacillus marchantiophytorum]|uniref:Uncharacterized protein n=1 Tax=Paenibacillus marchantiophytorum TaxID=1619310 RepID=A0ABQ1FCJ0_9BACL|nr:hypothetical protein [Paenibacillus marchantiophytorum]GGA06511.1 hypothetical protein GCM10008018_60470 [Paenibacillus marchantiophytorum]